MADYLTYAERPVQYTILTRRLRDIARLSENITDPREWEQIGDLLQDLEYDVWEASDE